MATRNLGQKVPKFKENLKLRNFVTYPIQEAKFYVVTTPRQARKITRKSLPRGDNEVFTPTDIQ